MGGWARDVERTRAPSPVRQLVRACLSQAGNSGEVLNYAFGLRAGERGGLPTIGHGGSYMGFQASYTRFPEQQFATWVLCNMGRIRPGPLGLQVADLFLAEQMGR
jgi:hypothetical protein